jgi:hypothetical protein
MFTNEESIDTYDIDTGSWELIDHINISISDTVAIAFGTKLYITGYESDYLHSFDTETHMVISYSDTKLKH